MALPRDLSSLQLIECPRDAMQGWPHFIPTATKITYINSLLQVGFDTIDFGSFVSPKAIPQMADTKEVIEKLDLHNTKTKLLAIVANVRGATEAAGFDQIRYIGFPFSLSPVFQMRNTNSTMEESEQHVNEIQEICLKHDKELVLYFSMGFGNPYGDVYNSEIMEQWAGIMTQKGIKILSLADTVGVATPQQVSAALQTLIPAYPGVRIGVHLHSSPGQWKEKMKAALDAGCMRFDGALKGIGGCPMAQDELVGNMDTEKMIAYIEEKQTLNLDPAALAHCSRMAAEIFA